MFFVKKNLLENHCITNSNVYNKAYIDSDNTKLQNYAYDPQINNEAFRDSKKSTYKYTGKMF